MSMFISLFSCVILAGYGLWYWQKTEKRIAVLEGALNDAWVAHCEDMDTYEYNVKKSLTTLTNRVRDGRCQDVVDELDYMIEHFDVYRSLTR
ncbi:hypothetical protein B1I25_08165 [Salmonella enterica]|nr:hypothetical protein [Salmonella enterica]EAP4011177.1 hypothetical protein [Salmonella enterica]EBI4018215.1 hypothetical protein [Salmonella enterica]EBI8321234.1 hypothetical protein [Salmonella enterica]EBI9356010.1 hypothetical protein [Salmonella enterica]